MGFVWVHADLILPLSSHCVAFPFHSSVTTDWVIGSRVLQPDVIPVTSLLTVNCLELPRGSGPHARVFTVVTERVSGQNLLAHAFGAATRSTCPIICMMSGSRRGGVSIARPASRLQCHFLHHDHFCIVS